MTRLERLLRAIFRSPTARPDGVDAKIERLAGAADEFKAEVKRVDFATTIREFAERLP